MTIHIKNMVCNRCITAVENVFRNSEIDVISVNLGWVDISTKISKIQLEKLNENLKKIGLIEFFCLANNCLKIDEIILTLIKIKLWIFLKLS